MKEEKLIEDVVEILYQQGLVRHILNGGSFIDFFYALIAKAQE